MYSMLENSTIGSTVDALQLALSIILVGFSVYVNWDGPMSNDEPAWMRQVEGVFTALFALDFACRLYVVYS